MSDRVRLRGVPEPKRDDTTRDGSAHCPVLTRLLAGFYTQRRSGVHRVLRWRSTPNPMNLIRLIPAEEELNLSLAPLARAGWGPLERG